MVFFVNTTKNATKHPKSLDKLNVAILRVKIVSVEFVQFHMFDGKKHVVFIKSEFISEMPYFSH